MTFHPPSVETQARIAREHKVAMAARIAETRKRLVELVKRDGEDSLWADMLREHDIRRVQEEAAEMEAKYPQGWRHYPGDTCKHGVYVGGCGADLMCGACESGDA